MFNNTTILIIFRSEFQIVDSDKVPGDFKLLLKELKGLPEVQIPSVSFYNFVITSNKIRLSGRHVLSTSTFCLVNNLLKVISMAREVVGLRTARALNVNCIRARVCTEKCLRAGYFYVNIIAKAFIKNFEKVLRGNLNISSGVFAFRSAYNKD